MGAGSNRLLATFCTDTAMISEIEENASRSSILRVLNSDVLHRGALIFKVTLNII